MKMLIILLLFSVSCAHLKKAEVTVYVNNATILTKYGEIIKIKNAEMYRNLGFTQFKTNGVYYKFTNCNIKHISIETGYILP